MKKVGIHMLHSAEALILYLGCSQVFSILFLAGSREEDDIINGLDQLQLHNTFDKEPSEQLLISQPCVERQ